MRIHFSGSNERARKITDSLIKLYGHYDIDNADIIVALGGDGFVLRTIHENIDKKIPIYGINCGNVGFLTNTCDLDNLPDKISSSSVCELQPIIMEAINSKKELSLAFAINEVYLLRQTHQAAKLKVKVSDVIRLDEMIGDGIIISTPVGSTAYNLSAHGPIIPVGSKLLALTPINAFRPRRWRGALLKDSEIIEIEINESEKRPVYAVADYLEFRDIVKISIKQDNKRSVKLLFDSNSRLEDRVLEEQFSS